MDCFLYLTVKDLTPAETDETEVPLGTILNFKDFEPLYLPLNFTLTV